MKKLSTAKDFEIYNNGLFKNFSLLNDTGKEIFKMLKLINMGDQGFFSDYKDWKRIKRVVVTSQQRDWGGQAHIQDKAIDLWVDPIYMIPFIACWLYRVTPYTYYISIHNKHVHCESLNKNHVKAVEQKNSSETIVVVPLSESIIDKVITYYIPVIGTGINYQLHPTDILLLRSRLNNLLKEKVSINQAMDKEKELKGEKPSFLKAVAGLGIFIAGTALIYFLYKKSEKKTEVNNESRKSIKAETD